MMNKNMSAVAPSKNALRYDLDSVRKMIAYMVDNYGKYGRQAICEYETLVMHSTPETMIKLNMKISRMIEERKKNKPNASPEESGADMLSILKMQNVDLKERPNGAWFEGEVDKAISFALVWTGNTPKVNRKQLLRGVRTTIGLRNDSVIPVAPGVVAKVAVLDSGSWSLKFEEFEGAPV